MDYRVGSLLVAVFVLSTARGQCRIELGPRQGYGPSGDARGIAIGDLDSDGRADVVTANFQSENVSVYRGFPDGTFGFYGNFGVGGSTAYAVALGDLNADGRLDAAVAKLFGDSIAVLLGVGNGSFQPAVTYGAGSYCSNVAIGDVNGDGRLDVVATGQSGGQACVLLGVGNGTLQSSVNYGVGDGPDWVSINDLNGDGRADLVTVNYDSNNISVCLGTGQAHPSMFAPAQNYPTDVSPKYGAIADLNHDGILDVVTANYWPSTVSVLLGKLGGAFGRPTSYPVEQNCLYIAVGDIDLDGNNDILISPSLAVLYGNGNGHLSVPGWQGGGGKAIALHDFNADGRLDVATANANLDVYLNHLASFPPPQVSQQPVGAFVEHGQTVTLSVTATSESGLPLSYRWRKNGNALANGDNIAGANSATLTINPARPSNTAHYDVVVSIPACGGGSVTTASASVDVAVTAPECATDFDGDGFVTGADFDAFVEAFELGCN